MREEIKGQKAIELIDTVRLCLDNIQAQITDDNIEPELLDLLHKDISECIDVLDNHTLEEF